MKRWNKLVRDRIPAIIAADGDVAKTKTLNNEEFIDALKEKLLEEIVELMAAEGDEIANEAADVIEVVMAFCTANGIRPQDVDRARKTKLAQRGGFEERVFLIETNRL